MRLANDRQLLPSIPKVRVLPENNTRQGFFERPDLEAVVAALPDYLRDLTRFAYLTGWRKGEIISLEWTDVDRDAGAIRLRPEAAKTGRGRTVMLEGDLAELIDRRWESRLLEKDGNVRVTALVFHRDGKPVGDFKKAWVTACQAAGVPEKLFHDLRRTAARNMVRAGVPERVAMAVTGHVTRSMFDRYNIVSEDDLRMAAQKTTMYVDTLPTTRPRANERAPGPSIFSAFAPLCRRIECREMGRGSENHCTRRKEQEGIMKMLSGVLTLVLLLGTVPVVWAQGDPAKEIADINRKRGEAGAKGDIDGLLADVADNVIATVARAGFRIEGKQAFRAFLTNLFQNYPTRQELGRQATYRVYQEGNVVVVNSYTDQTFIDKNGRMSTMMQRNSQTWVKTAGRWLLVDQHNSGMPGAPYTP